MTRAQRHFAVIFAAIALLLAPASLYAQREISGQGTEGFRALIAGHRFRPLRALKDVDDDPKRTLIIAFRGVEAGIRGDLMETLDRSPQGSVRGFVERGGAVLYASDQRKMDGWVERFDVRISGDKLYGGNASQCYQARNICPYVSRAVGASPELFRGGALMRVATNKPSYLDDSRELDTLASYKQPIRTIQRNVGLVAFAQAKRYESGGRILVLADQSVFINDMLLPEDGDTDNLKFAASCLDWLSEGPDLTKRDRVLFIDQTGVIETDFDLALATLPPLPVDPSQIPDYLWANRKLLWEHRDKISDLEDSGFFRYLEEANVFNRLLLSIADHWVWVRFALAIATITLLFFGLKRFFASRYRRAKASRLAVALDRYRPRVALLEQRLRSAMSRGQAYEAAREKARQFFADFELTPADFGQTPPECAIDAGWWTRRTLTRDLREIWRIAFSGEVVPVSTRAWPSFLKRLQNLRQAIRKGIIRFV